MESLITIIIPVFNVEKYIEDCIRTVINQTYENLEILVVDDCGTDNSINIARAIVSKSNKQNCFRYIQLPQNNGMGVIRNSMIKEAKGKYIFFLDSDDCISPECISTLYDYLTRNNLEFVCGSTAITDELLNTQETQIFKRQLITDNQSLLRFVFGQYHKICLYTSWNKLYKTTFLRENDIQFTNGRIYEDSFFFLQLIYHTNKCAFLENITYKYRQHKDSIMNASSKTFSYRNIGDMTYTLNIEKEYIKRLKDNALYGLIIHEYARRSYYYARGYYKNSNNTIPLKGYINDILRCPITFIEAIHLKEITCKQKIKICAFIFIDRTPYFIKKMILSL